MTSFLLDEKYRAWWLVGALFALALPATFPLWQTDFIFTADSPLHLWRVYELDRALRQGVIYPRWAPDLYFGYGYPLFNFYPPLSYYLAETLHVFGFDIAAAIKIVFALSIFLAAGGMFLLARDVYANAFANSNQEILAGLLCAAAYVYSPYLLLDIYTRGALAEALGMAVLPLFVWAMRRVFTQPSVAHALTTGIIGAAFFTSHNLTAFFAAPALAGFVLVKLFTVRERARALLLLALALAVTLSLSAFYWLPATTELAWVTIGQPDARHAELLRTMSEHFQPLARAIQTQWFYEYPEGPFPLSLGSLLLGGGGLLGAFVWLKKSARAELLYWSIVALLTIFLLTDASREAWLAFPSLWVIQFPWRLTVLIALATALASGGWLIVAQRVSPRVRVTIVVAALLIINLAAIGLLNLRAQPWQTRLPRHTEFQVLARFEANVRAGLGSMDEYLPQWTRLVPQPLTTQRAQNIAPAPASVPEIKFASLAPDAWRVETNAPENFVLRWRAFYYPDYYAQIDSQNATLRAGTPLGLLTLDVPQGQHQIQLQHASLPTRDAAWALTALAFLSLSAWTLWQIRRGARAWKMAFGILFLLALAFLTPQTRAWNAAPRPFVAARLDVDDALRVIAYRVEMDVSEKIKLGIVWHVKRTLVRETPVRLRLLDQAGREWSARSMWARYGTGGMREWFPNELAQDSYDLFLPPDLPRGEYTLQLKRANSEWVTLTTLALDSQTENTRAEPSVSQSLDAQFGETIRLLAFDAPSLQNARANSEIPITLFWRAESDVLEDYSVFLQLLDKDGKLAAQRDSLPNNGFTPTMLWQPGETVRDAHTLQLPSNLAPGSYRLVTGLYRFRDLSRLPLTTSQGASDEDFVVLGQVKIPTDIPSFAPAQRLQIQVGPDIQLRGFTLESRGNQFARATNGAPAQLTASSRSTLHLTLEWFARNKLMRDYKVFVHLVDANGNVVRQQDSPPVRGAYPTSIWDANERVVDALELALNDLATGEYVLRVGMYDAETGERLPLTNSDGTELPNRALELARVTLVP